MFAVVMVKCKGYLFQADVVAQTKISYDDKELFQLIHKYLENRGGILMHSMQKHFLMFNPWVIAELGDCAFARHGNEAYYARR